MNSLDLGTVSLNSLDPVSMLSGSLAGSSDVVSIGSHYGLRERFSEGSVSALSASPN